MMQKIAVLGGGITGVTTAYALAREGFNVTLFERHRYAAMETSFANGGQLSASNAEVWTHWSTVLKGLRWMLRADAPLLVNPRPSWHKLSWFAQFIAAIPRYEDNTVATAQMAIAARKPLFEWAAEEGVEFDLRQEGILHIYRDRASFEHAGRVSKLLERGGLTREALSPAQMRAVEPTLAGEYYGGYYTRSDATGDIHKFTTGLAAAAQRRQHRVLRRLVRRTQHRTGSGRRRRRGRGGRGGGGCRPVGVSSCCLGGGGCVGGALVVLFIAHRF